MIRAKAGASGNALYMTVLLVDDRDGKIVFKHFGKIKPDELRAAIDKEIKK